MFRAKLETELKEIFGVAKVTFDFPGGETFEQDCFFIDTDEVQTSIGGGEARAVVRGTITTFSQKNKLPYGFFNKRLLQAKAELTQNFFFFDIDIDVATSPARLINISERRTRFVYLYKDQYDPKQGSITSLELSGE